MEISDALAITALIVSIVSAWLSHKAQRETTAFSEREESRAFARERSEFLIRIERSTKLFERTEVRISQVLTSIMAQPEPIRASLNNATVQLQSDLKYLEGCIRQSRALWGENFEMSYSGLAHHKAHDLALLEDDEGYAAGALERADEAENSLNTSLFISNPIVG